jgi:hypothetical protein
MEAPILLALDDPRWGTLRHAYGQADDIPALLRELESFPPASTSAAWFSLWSALAHQGDVFSASFAAVPHVVRVLAADPVTAGPEFFHFPAWVEICRWRKGVEIPQDLSEAYHAALARLPGLVASASAVAWSEEKLACALAAVAAAKGHPHVAEVVLELNEDVAGKFLEWFFAR